jgi:hypothetical protein
VGVRALIALVALGSGIAAACSLPVGASAHGDSWAPARAVGPVTVSGFLYPGAPPSPVRVTVWNRTGHPILIKKVRVAVRSISAPGCSTSWFRTTPAKKKRGFTVAAKHRVTVPRKGTRAPTIEMVESGTDQNACQGARLTLAAKAKAKTTIAHPSRASSDWRDRVPVPALLLALPVAGLLLGGRGLARWRRP